MVGLPDGHNGRKVISSTLYDLIGVGIGPFNLSLSALAQATPINTLFLDKKKEFSWHQLCPIASAELQVSYLKDLVVPVDPTNRFSFLNYLVSENRIYEFLNRRTSTISRYEFNLYYKWVAEQIPSLIFGQEVIGLGYTKECFIVSTRDREYKCKNLCIGTGKVENVGFDIGQEIEHKVHYYSKYRATRFSGLETILVVGGGQSGAEVVYDLLSKQKVQRIIWVSSRNNLLSLDDTSFVNEFYGPSYRDHFMHLEDQIKEEELHKQKMSSDGVSVELINELYNLFYENKYLNEKKVEIEVLFSTRVESIGKCDTRVEASISSDFSGELKVLKDIDSVIVATGFAPFIPPFLVDFMDQVCVDPLRPLINRDLSISPSSDLPGKVFMQNRARMSHGLQDSNLALVSYRNALIINALLKVPYYTNLSEKSTLVTSFCRDAKMVSSQTIKLTR